MKRLLLNFLWLLSVYYWNLYIDRWNSSQNFEKQFESTLRIVQQNLVSDIYNSDNTIAHFHSRDSLRHDVMMNKFDLNIMKMV